MDLEKKSPIPKISPRECDMCKKVEYVDPKDTKITVKCVKCQKKLNEDKPTVHLRYRPDGWTNMLSSFDF